MAVVVGIFALVGATSLISANAISQSSKAQAALAKSLAAQSVPVKPVISSVPGIWLTGDSVILGIRYELEQRERIGLINARVGRQAGELITVIRHDLAAMSNSPIVLDLGNNNKLTETEVATIFELIKNQPQIIIVNTAVPRGWRDDNDALIAQYARKYSQASLVDWKKISDGHPEYFGPDGVHLVPAGITAYVNAIVEKIHSPDIK